MSIDAIYWDLQVAAEIEAEQLAILRAHEKAQTEPHVILAKKYIAQFHTLGIIHPKQTKEGSTSHEHLLWMLYQILNDHDQSLTKKHRWLGFVQGCMVCDGIFDVESERNATRDILNGK